MKKGEIASSFIIGIIVLILAVGVTSYFKAPAPISGNVVSPPSAPTGLTATIDNNQVSLSWNMVPDATKYNIWKGYFSGQETTYRIGVPSNSFIDTDIMSGTTGIIYYKVSAVNDFGESALSSEVSITIPLTIPTCSYDASTCSSEPVTIRYAEAYVNDFNLFFVGGKYSADADINMSYALKTFYSKHCDDLDFLLIFTNFLTKGDSMYSAISTSNSNHIQGISAPLRDGSLETGSCKLQSRIYFTKKSFIDNWVYVGDYIDSSAKVDKNIRAQLFLHEIGHRWINVLPVKYSNASYVNKSLMSNIQLTHLSGNLIGECYFMNRLDDSNYITDNKDGTLSINKYKYYKSESSSENLDDCGRRILDDVSYSDLELYLMGLKSKEEVKNKIWGLAHPSRDITLQDKQNSVTIPGYVEYFTVDDIIKAMGTRIPDSSNSQKNFKIGALILTFSGVNDDYTQTKNIATKFLFDLPPVWEHATEGRSKLIIQCPLCQQPSFWSACINNQQTRTNYECNAATNWQCYGYTEKQGCIYQPRIIPSKKPTTPTINPLCRYISYLPYFLRRQLGCV